MRVLPCLLLFLPIGGPLAQTTFSQRLEQLREGQRDSLHLEEGVFQTRRLKPGEDQQFPEHTQEELRTAFTTECLWPGAPSIEELSPMEPHPDDTRIVLDRIVLRVRYDGPSGPGEKHLLMMVPSGC